MNTDRITNIAFGLTFINLSVVGITSIQTEALFLSMVRFGAVLCNIVMGITLLFNKDARSDASPLHRPFWLGMIICNIIAVKMVNETLPLVCIQSAIYITGIITTLISVASLGQSFSVTPMISTIKTSAIYKLVRHPMYLGETLMLIACGFASESLIIISVIIVYLYITVLRILEEEKVLRHEDAYIKYCHETKWRLIPYIW